jgi:hypothetical protein
MTAENLLSPGQHPGIEVSIETGLAHITSSATVGPNQWTLSNPSGSSQVSLGFPPEKASALISNATGEEDTVDGGYDSKYIAIGRANACAMGPQPNSTALNGSLGAGDTINATGVILIHNCLNFTHTVTKLSTGEVTTLPDVQIDFALAAKFTVVFPLGAETITATAPLEGGGSATLTLTQQAAAATTQSSAPGGAAPSKHSG